MGWNAILAADLELGADAVDSWKALAIDDADWDDWGRLTRATPPGVAPTVRESLARLDEMARGCAARSSPDWLEITLRGGALRVRGRLGEDDYRSIARDLAIVVRASERVGARGQYVALTDDDNDGERTVVEDGASWVESIVMTDVLAGAAKAPGGLDYAGVVDEIDAVSLRKAATPARPAPAKKPAVTKTTTTKAKKRK